MTDAVDRLPFELKALVLRSSPDAAPEWPTLSNDWRSVLRKASCLNRAWHDVSAVLLVDTVHLRSVASILRLAQRLAEPDGDELGVRIRRIVVAPDASVVYAREVQVRITLVVSLTYRPASSPSSAPPRPCARSTSPSRGSWSSPSR